jgi:hypothetical protein
MERGETGVHNRFKQHQRERQWLTPARIEYGYDRFSLREARGLRNFPI